MFIDVVIPNKYIRILISHINVYPQIVSVISILWDGYCPHTKVRATGVVKCLIGALVTIGAEFAPGLWMTPDVC